MWLKSYCLITIRDGNSENGGSNYNMRFSEMYLSLINCKYLVSDNSGRDFDEKIILNDQELLSFYGHESNRPFLLKGLREFSWSENGNFCGDAHLYQVQKLF